MEICLQNLGMYNEGKHLWKWLTIPFSEEELNDAFVDIKLGYYDEDGEFHFGYEENGVLYEEYFITDYCTNGLFEVSEYANLDEINELAERIESLNKWQLDDLKSVYEVNGYIDESLDIVEMGDYILLSDVSDEEELGRYVVEEGLFGITIPDGLMDYIDFEAIGRDWANDYDFVEGGAICITR